MLMENRRRPSCCWPHSCAMLANLLLCFADAVVVSSTAGLTRPPHRRRRSSSHRSSCRLSIDTSHANGCGSAGCGSDCPGGVVQSCTVTLSVPGCLQICTCQSPVGSDIEHIERPCLKPVEKHDDTPQHCMPRCTSAVGCSICEQVALPHPRCGAPEPACRMATTAHHR